MLQQLAGVLLLPLLCAYFLPVDIYRTIVGAETYRVVLDKFTVDFLEWRTFGDVPYFQQV